MGASFTMVHGEDLAQTLEIPGKIESTGHYTTTRFWAFLANKGSNPVSPTRLLSDQPALVRAFSCPRYDKLYWPALRSAAEASRMRAFRT